MKRITKTICVALSLMLLVNLAGVEAAAADAGTANQTEDSQEKNDVLTSEPKGDADDADKADGGAENGSQTDKDDESGDTAAPGADSPSDTDDNNVPESNAPVTGDVDLDTELPEQGGAGDEDGNSVSTQDITGLKAEPVAGKNQLKTSWTAVSGSSYTLEVFGRESISGTAEITENNINAGEKVIDVTSGTRYTIKVTDNQSAEQIIPAILLTTPTNLKAVASNGAVALTWTAVAGAQSYKVEYNGGEKVVTSPSCTVTGLANGTSYNFSVTPQAKFNESGENYEYSSAAPADVSAAPIGNKPSQVTGLTGIDGEKSAILTWSKAAYADSYAVYRYNSSKKTWEVVKSGLTQLTYTDTNLKAGQNYQYRVAGVNANGTGTLSSAIKISVKKTPGTKVRSIGYRAVVKSRAPLFGTAKSSKRLKYLGKGKKVTTTDYSNGRYEVKIGKKYYWISKDRLKFKSSIWTTKDYSTKVKEDFVNKKRYSSPSKYLIWISHYTQRVVIYQGSKGKWKVIRSAKCATGTHLHMTPKGKFKVGKKEKGWFYKKTFEKPIVHFKGQNSFHSRIKNYKGGYADATIGRPRSKGCVRLYDEDINFIYKKCPKGTTVISL